MKHFLSRLSFFLVISALSGQNPAFMDGWELPDIAVFGEPSLQKFLDAGAQQWSWSTENDVKVITEVKLDGRRFNFYNDGSLFFYSSRGRIL